MKGALVLLSFIILVYSQTDLILNGTTLNLGGRYTYRNVVLTNNAKIVIPTFNGADFVNTGNLELTITGDLTIDTTSGIFGRGAGWQPKLCSFGSGPFSSSGGRGGCAVFDSGGGGAHLGDGGFGTKDCPNSICVFPRDEEEACEGDWVPASTTCSSFVNCRQNLGFPETIGIGWSHSVFNNSGGIGLGAAGGDKGCRDGDGKSGIRGGAGGGRVFLNITGSATINGKINMDGYRGCSLENDSGGGGAGGTIIILANTINLGAVANVTASGGLGGDSVSKDLVENPECIGTQIGGTCDDCGGGGGGGIIYLNAPNGNFYDPQRVYDRILRVDGSKGGACLGCNYEARGQDGRISYGHRYEYCDGQDNTYDGEIDENQPLLQPCGLPSCVNGVPVYSCPDPTTAIPTTAAPTTAVPTTAVPTTAVSTTGANTVIPTSANVATTDTGVAGTSNAVSSSDNGASSDLTQGSQGSQSNGSQGSGSNGQPIGTSENPEGSASALCSSMFIFGLLVLYL